MGEGVVFGIDTTVKADVTLRTTLAEKPGAKARISPRIAAICSSRIAATIPIRSARGVERSARAMAEIWHGASSPTTQRTAKAGCFDTCLTDAQRMTGGQTAPAKKGVLKR